ncbi:MAG: PAS domain-containing protein [Janthinobacterium lividum]
MRKNNSQDSEPVGPSATSHPGGIAAGMGSDAESLLEALPWGLVVLDAHGTVLRLNQRAAHWWGISQPALRGQRLGPATAGPLPADLQQALQQVTSDLPPSGEFFLPQHQQWVALSSARQADHWVVYWQDVTAQKQHEHEHQARQAASDSLLRRTEAVARTGSYELELATGQTYASDGLFRLFGEEPGAFTLSPSFIAARSHPDDVVPVQQVLAQAIADQQPYYYQRRIYRPDGQLRTLEAHGRVECDAQGQPVKLLSLLQDVTEREQAAQETLRVKDELAQRATANYTALYHSMDEGFCIVEVLFDAAQQPVDYRFLDVNPAFEKQTGLHEALGKTIRELVPAHEQYWFESYGQVARTGEPTRFEANGESMGRWFDVNAFPVGPPQPQPRHVAVLFTDITARKQTEQALRESDAHLRQAVGLAHLGICHWSYRTNLMRGNDERFLMLGLNPAQEVISGEQAIALTHPDDRATWASIRQQAEAHGEFWASYRIVRPSDGAVRWISEMGRVVAWQEAKPAHVSSVLLDVTADHEAAEALRRSEIRYRSLFANMEQGFCLLEKVATAPHEPSDYRYLAVNQAFTRHTGLRDVTGQTIRQVVWQAEPRIMALYDEVVATGETRRLEEYLVALDIWIEAEVVPDAQPGHLAVLLSNVTARRRAEQTLRESETRQTYLLALSDALRPVRDAVAAQAIVTHTIRHYFRADRCFYSEIEGATMTIRQEAARPDLPSVAGAYGFSAMPIFNAMLRESQLVVVNDVNSSPFMDDSLKQLCRDGHILSYINVPVTRHGKVVSNLCIAQSTPREWTAIECTLMQETAERTWVAVERARAEDAQRQSEEQFRLLVTATSDIVYRMGADWTQMEQLLGKNFLADTLSPTHTWGEEYIPADDLPQVQAAIAEAIRQKSPFELEHRVRRADGTVGWTHSRAIPMLGAQGELTGWLGAARDVSARKEAERQLLEFNARLEQQVAERTQALGDSQARLQSVFDSVTTGVALMHAVRDADGHLLDFEYVLVNPVAQTYYKGQAMIGQRYGKLHPGIHHTPIFSQLAAVVETGQRADFEVHYDYEAYNHWYRLVGVKLGDGLLYTAEDITARKLLEQEQARSLTLLQQSEDMAGLGSWDYDLETGELTWSDGLYHLLGRPVGSAVGPQLFLDAVLDDDRPAAARLVRTLAEGTRSFDAPLRLRVGEAVKTVRFKAVPLPYPPGPPERVLGVCLDVSDVARLEAENLALKLDRHKELLLGILQAQENERQRLAEVLHNSLGQVLYATKLHLDQLDTPALKALPALAGLHQQTGRLLAEAMRQTRTLAHELVPTSLANFGLAVAVRDVCRDLSTPQLRVVCQVWGEEQELPQPVQVTLFRLAQELAHNIVRHAGATQALLELETLPDWVSLRAEDDGRGFDPQTVAEGLGLRTVRDAVALLGGSVAIDSSPEFGTHIRLRIPLPLFSRP